MNSKYNEISHVHITTAIRVTVDYMLVQTE
jgi:hypothetical protein